ncbi:MAG: hypothetical protein HQ495_03425 [Alphaproteobacteria bacterium]|nr:hypothetical protein [Alphaproteobacteria bacterium]
MTETNITRLRMHSPPGEKRGNTSWVQCGSCDGWFHVTEDLITRGTVKMHCTHCHTEFLPPEAKKIVLA